MSDKKEPLAPCPFCGSEPDEETMVKLVTCSHLTCPLYNVDMSRDDWNRRAPSPRMEPLPLPMVMYCPAGHQHIDRYEWATKPHKTHQCQVIPGCRYPNCRTVHTHEICGLEFRPANFPTVGVAALDKEAGN